MARHMSLQEWDRRVAPFLHTILIRSRHIQADAEQIRAWVEMLPVAPDFDTEAFEHLRRAYDCLDVAVKETRAAIERYQTKEKVS